MNDVSNPNGTVSAYTNNSIRESSTRKLWKFHGGVHPKFNKEMSNQSPIKQASIPTQLNVPLQQSIGNGATPIVALGDYVYKGQIIAKQTGKLSATVHAPTSGTVIEVSEKLIPHPSGLYGLCIVIDCDAKDNWGDQKFTPITDFQNIDIDSPNNALLERIQQCGIVGLGGATFPTAVKVNTKDRTVENKSLKSHRLKTLIINGAECEPYISCDDRLMQERTTEILKGIDILQHLLKPENCIIAIEDNKPNAIQAFRKECENRIDIEVVSIPTIYPSGGEKQLIEILTGEEVPTGGLPIELGLISINPGTVYSVYKAVIEGEPLISRIVTVTGNGIVKPQNFEVLIGTSFKHLAEQAGGYTEFAEHLVMGGPMMGFGLEDDSAPIVKATNCALFISSKALNESSSQSSQNAQQATLPCIRCGKCMDVCPVKLLPQQLFWHIQAKDLEKAVEHNLHDCIDCGCCSYVCPSKIPLVDYYRFAKTELREQQLATEKSNIARERFEFLTYRRERDKREREEKRAAHKAALLAKKAEVKNNQTVDTEKEDPKVAAIKAAMARAKAKKLERQHAQETKDTLTNKTSE